MTWAPLILSLIKLAVNLQVYVRERQLLQAGEDRAIAAATLELLEITQAGKELRERIKTAGDLEADALWQRMGEADVG